MMELLEQGLIFIYLFDILVSWIPAFAGMTMVFKIFILKNGDSSPPGTHPRKFIISAGPGGGVAAGRGGLFKL